MIFFLLGLVNRPTYKECIRDSSGKIINCSLKYWNPNYAQIPCSALPVNFIQCITHSFEKFEDQFEEGILPSEGCPRGHRSESEYGIAVCTALSGITCIGEQYWLNTSYPCYEDGDSRVIIAVILSFFVGFFGADRFYLDYYFLGILKLFSFGGLGIWWLIDFILLIFGYWGPRGSKGYSLHF